MRVYDKGMHALLSGLFLSSQDFELNNLMNTYPERRNWNGLAARSSCGKAKEVKGEKLCSIQARFQAAPPLLVTLSC